MAQNASFPISFEFFPTKTAEGAAKHVQVRQALYARQPEFCSVTYGAGGSTQSGTFAMVQAIQQEGVAAASHFSCIGATRQSVRSQLQQLKDMGVRRLVALRGDLPSGYGVGGEFQYASDLVAFIRAEFGDFFHIEVAAYPEVHPQARSPEADLRALAAKAQAGANSAITQYFFDADAYARFVDDAQRLGVYSRSSGYHADPQRNPAYALFRCDRRRNPPLDTPQAPGLWRRYGLDPRLRPGCGHSVV